MKALARLKNRMTISDKTLREKVTDKDWMLRMMDSLSPDQLLAVSTSEGNSPLHLICRQSHPSVLVAAIRCLGARAPDAMHLQDRQGNTPLHLVSHYQDTSCVLAVIRASNNQARLVRQKNNAGVTALEVMAWNESDETGCSSKVGTEALTKFFEIVGEGEAKAILGTPTSLSPTGQTPFHHIARNHDGAALRAAITLLGNNEVQRICLLPLNGGCSPLGHLAGNYFKKHTDDSLHILLAALGPRAAEVLAMPSKTGITPLHIVASNTFERWTDSTLRIVLDKLGSRAAEVLAMPSNNGWTPLHVVAGNEFKQWTDSTLRIVLDKLGSRAAEVLAMPDNNGWTPLHVVANNECGKWTDSTLRIVLDKLGSRAAEVLAMPNNDGLTPLLMVAFNYCKKWTDSTLRIVLDKLGSRAAEVLAMPSNNGLTPLHCVAANPCQKWTEQTLRLVLAGLGEQAKMIAEKKTSKGTSVFDYVKASKITQKNFQSLIEETVNQARRKRLVKEQQEEQLERETQAKAERERLAQEKAQQEAEKARLAREKAQRETVIKQAVVKRCQSLRKNWSTVSMQALFDQYADLIQKEPKLVELYIERSAYFVYLAEQLNDDNFDKKITWYEKALKDIGEVLCISSNHDKALSEKETLSTLLLSLKSAQTRRKNYQELRSRWASDAQRAIVADYEKLVSQFRDDSLCYREFGEYYVYLAEKATAKLQKTISYKNALSHFEKAVEVDLADGLAARRHEEIEAALNALSAAPISSSEKLPAISPRLSSATKSSTRSTAGTTQETSLPSISAKGGFSSPIQHGSLAHIPWSEIERGEVLGQGAFGRVSSGLWQRTTRIALKELHNQQMNTALFEREAELHLQLRHTNIVSLLGICVGPMACVLELMAQGSLKQVLRHSDQPLPWLKRVSIAKDIATGLSFLHSRKILHQDLKSDNVLLDEYGVAKLSDFGLSTIKTESQSQTRANAAGTLAWMAPEVLGKKKDSRTPASDVYSLGIVLWEIASRREPYADKEVQELLFYIMMGNREEIPQDALPVYKSLIERCWAQRAEDRPESLVVAQELAGVIFSTQTRIVEDNDKDKSASVNQWR